jgi:hypothetical protein
MTVYTSSSKSKGDFGVLSEEMKLMKPIVDSAINDRGEREKLK